MADLPELVDLPPEVAEPAYGNRAAWFANTFGGSDTNLVQRRRHNVDLRRYAEGAQAQQAAHQMETLAQDKGAQDLWFRQQQLGLQREKARADLALRHDLATVDIENKRSMIDLREQTAPLIMEAKRAQIAATGATAKLRAMQDARQATDTAEFSSHIAELIERGVKPHSDEWSAGIAVGLSEFPFANPAMVRQYGASLFPKEDLTPEEMIARAHTLKTALPDATVKVTPSNVSITEPNTVKDDERMLQVLTGQRTRLNPKGEKLEGDNLDKAKALDELINETKSRLTDKRTPESTQERVATNPKTGEKLVFREGKWQPLN